MKSEILALNRYSIPNGIALFEPDLNEEEKALNLFDSCQILESIIYAKGWQYLLHTYKFMKLYKIDLESGWFETDTKKEWLVSILYNMLMSGFNAQTGSFGKHYDKVNTFKTIEHKIELIEWEKFKARDYFLNDIE